MKSNRTFNRIISTVVGFVRWIKWWDKSSSYADPHLSDPHHRQRTRNGTKVNQRGQKRLQAPDLIPGTITHKDWLVRELGYDRRLADGYYYAFLNGYNIKMPMPSDLVAS